MAGDSINDGTSAFNRRSKSSRLIDPQLSKYLADLSDEFIGRLMEARALIAVGTHGLCKSSEAAQQCFLGVVDDILEGAILSFEEIIENHLVESEKFVTQAQK